MARNDGMSDKELVVYLAGEIENAINDEDGDVSDVRQKNFDRYYGKAYGDEEDGRSTFVTRETFEAVEWAIPSILRFFTGTSRSVEFEPLNEEDEEQAGEETDVVNHIVLHRNEGFLMLYEFVKSLLMYPNGYLKVWVDEREVVEVERQQGVTEVTLAEIEQREDMELIEVEEREQTIELPSGIPGTPPVSRVVTVYDVAIRIVKTEKKLRVESLPPEEVLVSDTLYSVNMERATFVCHRRQATVSELVQMGYDADEVKAAGERDDNSWNDERVNRLFYEEESPDAEDQKAGAERLIWVHECYANVDFDGDDISEKRFVFLIGDTIFENEEVSFQPIISSSAIIMPNKHVGMSYIEAVENLQLVSTVLTRQMLDNIYAHNDKRHFINEGALLPDNSTMDNYLDASSTIIPVQGNPAEVIMPETSQPIIPELLSVIQHMGEKTQIRTGVAPQVSLDPSTLKESTMGAFMGALEHASQRLEVLVRIIAETAIKPLYKKVHYLTRQHLNDAISLKIRGRWVNASPSDWINRDNIKVNVGIGNANRQSKMQALQFVLMQQSQIGMQTGMATAEQFFNTLEEIVEIGGLGGISKFFIEPSEENIQSGRYVKPQPPQPDPIQMGQLQALMIDAQARADKGKADAALAQMKMRNDMDEFMKEMAFKLAEAQRDNMKLKAEIEDRNERRDIEGNKAVAEIRNRNRDSELKVAQREKLEEEAERIEREALSGTE